MQLCTMTVQTTQTNDINMSWPRLASYALHICAIMPRCNQANHKPMHPEL
jgi:hypothetical protein